MFEKTYFFYGKHADMVIKLTGKLDDEVGVGLFESNHMVYRIAPVIGLIYNRKADVDKSSESSTRILDSQMVKNMQYFFFNYRNIIMKTYESLPQKERMDIAFRLDYKDEERKQYDVLFNQYVLGGVEVLYEEIFEKNKPKTADDYLRNLYDFLEDYHARCYHNLTAENYQ